MQHVQSIINSSAFTLISALKDIFLHFILTRKLLGIAPQYFYNRLYDRFLVLQRITQPCHALNTHASTLISHSKITLSSR